MKLISTSVIFSLVLLLTQSIAIPTPDPEPAPEEGALAERFWPDLSNLLPKKLCPGAPKPPSGPTQSNQCSTGVPYCCSTEGGSNNCVGSVVNCEQTVICCNNNFGYQVCMGDIDFNMPINIDIDIDL
ncbi:hypothetical protein AJ79_01452 [Helicocarpus griseus UAMH5409]|uniref:Hydrophobin n=1 Tax=Helicocarpus griseus UAMH5409 TaxID=1447875 RepID=A0A2B7Y7A7_9EURO|nr:hypothetical protein AJ79_01452 [Helicocarpus griseus UAMH5409]